MKTIITVIRHGETEWNKAMILQGQKDSPLTDLGVKQVEAVAKGLKNRTFDVLVSSDLKRAADTAECINRFHKQTIHFDKGLRERSFGKLEALNWKQLRELFPEAVEQYLIRNEEYEIPEGESLKQFDDRISETVKRIVKKYKGKRILLIAHGGILDCIIRWCFNYPLSGRRSFKLFNTSVNVFEVENDEWTLIEWGNVDHLGSLQCEDDAH